MKHLPRLLSLAVMFLGSLGSAAQAGVATRVDLDRDWSFKTDPESAGERAGWVLTTPPGAETVDVPHTWNRGAHRDYLGVAWYFQSFSLPKLPPRASVFLNFGATFYKARVWVNGVEIGAHEGGYHAWALDITSKLEPVNRIAVAIDNRPGMLTIPGFGARGSPDAWYDWWSYGGIVRHVWLDVHGPVRIAHQFIRSKLDGTKAVVTTRVSMISRDASAATLRASVVAPSGAVVATHQQSLKLAARDNEASFTVNLSEIQRWDLDHPNLYRMDLAVIDKDGNVIETARDSFGLRELEIRDRKLLLNGKSVRLTGMTRHADSPWEGFAETRGTVLHDWEDMKSLNMTLTRPVHYAPDPAALEFADKRGILLIPEIPIWQASEAQLSSPEYLALAKLQMRELIEQAGNHPSVFAWSVLNESAAGSTGGIKFFRAMRDYIKSLDPERPVTLADDNLPKLNRADESAANDADFLMMNQYFGAWHGPRAALGPALDKVNALFPTKMVIISELGFPGIFAANPIEADKMRVSILREQLPELAKRDWIAGAILWCYQDYKSRRYNWPGQEEGYLEHGLVDPDRQRKPSYFAWQELNYPARAELSWSRRDGGIPAAFSIIVTPNGSTSLPSLPLDGYKILWQLTGSENRAFASGERAADPRAPVTISADVPKRQKAEPFRLLVKLVRPDGTVAMERVLPAQ